MKLRTLLSLVLLGLFSAPEALALTDEEHHRFRAESREYARADSELNALWKQLRTTLPAESFNRIRAQQRQWVKAERDQQAMSLGATPEAYALVIQERVRELSQHLPAPGAGSQAVEVPAAKAGPAPTPAPRAATPPQAKQSALPPSSSSSQGSNQGSIRSGVIVRTVPDAAPVTHVPLPPQSPDQTGAIQTAATREQAGPKKGQANPPKNSPSGAKAAPETADSALPPARPSPVRVTTSEALGPAEAPPPPAQPTARSRRSGNPNAREFSGFPREYRHNGLRYVRLDNTSGRPMVVIGVWGNLPVSVQECLTKGIHESSPVTVYGTTVTLSDGRPNMIEDVSLTCDNE